MQNSAKHIYCSPDERNVPYENQIDARFIGWNGALDALIEGDGAFKTEVEAQIKKYGKNGAHKIFWFVADLLGNPKAASDSETIPLTEAQRQFLRGLDADLQTYKKAADNIIDAQYRCLNKCI
ncbi:Uncharacterised protein [uncultured archaeon]|nr:Uncharacterised protein [uncultured archaeon]